MNMNCHSQLDESQLIDAKGVAHHHMMTGSVNWAIALGRHDIQHAVPALLSVAPCHNNNHVVAPPWVLTAIILEQYKGMHQEEKVVLLTASRKMMIDWIEARQEHACSHHVQNTPTLSQDSIKSNPLCWLAMMSKHTLVCHPVGWHMDVFAKAKCRMVTRQVLVPLMTLGIKLGLKGCGKTWTSKPSISIGSSKKLL
jgi:hypothetical protein